MLRKSPIDDDRSPMTDAEILARRSCHVPYSFLFPTFDRADVFRENNTRGIVGSSSLRDIRRDGLIAFFRLEHCRYFCGTRTHV